MVGLSIVLESHKATNNTNTKKYHTQVLNKATMIIKPSPPPPPSLSAGFLDRCFLCHQRLLPGKDIYMYKGDRAFCSEECRCRQILMDEEETSISLYKKDSCSFAAAKSPKHPSPSSPSSSSSSPSSRNRKGTRNRANGFAY